MGRRFETAATPARVGGFLLTLACASPSLCPEPLPHWSLAGRQELDSLPIENAFVQPIPHWSVDPDPDLVIGVFEGPEPFVLFNVLDAVVLGDGTVVIGMFDKTAFELRYFDRDGSFLTSAGRRGEGPFELSSGFNSLERMTGDSLLIVSRDNRYSVFGPRGERVRSGRLNLTLSTLMMPWNLVDDCRLLFFSTSASSSQRGGGGNAEWSMSFSVLDLETGELAPIANLPAERVEIDENGAFLYFPLDPKPGWAAGSGSIWLGHGEDRVITGWTGDGIERVTVRLAWPGHAVTREDRGLLEEFNRRRGRASPRSAELPDTFPFFENFQVDTEGNLWVQRYEPPWSEEDYQWGVFNPAGVQIASVSLSFAAIGSTLRPGRPLGHSPLLEIGPDYMLVTSVDAVGAPVVRKHRLVKGPEALKG